MALLIRSGHGSDVQAPQPYKYSMSTGFRGQVTWSVDHFVTALDMALHTINMLRFLLLTTFGQLCLGFAHTEEDAMTTAAIMPSATERVSRLRSVWSYIIGLKKECVFTCDNGESVSAVVLVFLFLVSNFHKKKKERQVSKSYALFRYT